MTMYQIIVSHLQNVLVLLRNKLLVVISNHYFYSEGLYNTTWAIMWLHMIHNYNLFFI